jgi:hypothetical protein
MSSRRLNLNENLSRIKHCTNCGKALPRRHSGDLCDDCLYNLKYKDVKEYVLHNDVTELEVSDEFDLPLEVVQRWIREGHLSYKE